ncbi:MAG TPA: hypothetical protein PLC98_03930 [Anaerolineales bacterium]|nr:hypothetical protein [Anaerolineales bacterium]
MADMIGVSILLMLFATAFPAYLTLIWRVWPGLTDRARQRLVQTPGRSLVLGVALALVAGLPIFVLLALPNGVGQFLGFAGIVLVLAFAGIGAAGFAAHLGSAETLRGFLIGATLTELAMALPVIGWFLVTPLLLVASLGAGAFALLRWMPRAAATPIEPTAAAPIFVGETR